MSLLYTPGQLRNATELPLETYRHWKKVLGPLRRDRSHSPSFRPGDLVAVAVVQLLTQDFGIRVGALTPLAEPLFTLCNLSPWPILERSALVIELAPARVSLCQEQVERLPTMPAIIVPLAELVGQLRETLLDTDDPGEQGALRFPPTPLAAGGRG